MTKVRQEGLVNKISIERVITDVNWDGRSFYNFHIKNFEKIKD